jgi:hypothetical protein
VAGVSFQLARLRISNPSENLLAFAFSDVDQTVCSYGVPRLAGKNCGVWRFENAGLDQNPSSDQTEPAFEGSNVKDLKRSIMNHDNVLQISNNAPDPASGIERRTDNKEIMQGSPRHTADKARQRQGAGLAKPEAQWLLQRYQRTRRVASITLETVD